MIDIKEIRENPEKFKKAAKDKGFVVDIDKLININSKLKAIKQQLQNIAAEKNRIGASIPKITGNEKEQTLKKLEELKKEELVLKDRIEKADEQDFNRLMLEVAQPADPDVPLGKDDTENAEIKKVGEVRKFDFEPKDHVQLGLALDIIDIERGVKIAGTRNYFLKGDGALLHWAVLRFALDFMIAKGYVPMSPPLLMKYETMMGTGFYPGSEDQTYRTIDELSLAGTAEVPVTAYYKDEILTADDLPQKFVALSTCFRREAGAAGKDTYGLYRIHQFDKVEQVIICANDIEQSKKYHAEIMDNSEQVLQALELPYRVVNVCTGDLGRGQVQKFDIETWMPSRKSYGETHSASRFYEFQARRLNLRYKDAKTKKICSAIR